MLFWTDVEETELAQVRFLQFFILQIRMWTSISWTWTRFKIRNVRFVFAISSLRNTLSFIAAQVDTSMTSIVWRLLFGSFNRQRFAHPCLFAACSLLLSACLLWLSFIRNFVVFFPFHRALVINKAHAN